MATLTDQIYARMVALVKLAQASPDKSADDVLLAWDSTPKNTTMIEWKLDERDTESVDFMDPELFDIVKRHHIDGDEPVVVNTVGEEDTEAYAWRELNAKIITNQAVIAAMSLSGWVTNRIVVPVRDSDDEFATPAPKAAKRK